MKSEWKKIKAKDFIEFNPKITLKKGTVAKKIAMDKLSPFSKKIYDYEISSYSGGTKFCNDDTIMARITPCLENGKTAYIDFLEDDEVAFGSTEFIVLRAKKGISNSQFIYYLSISPKFRDIAIKSMVGSSGRQRVQQSVLEELELIVPPLKEQEKIGAFLKNIDDKIALNQQINNNLEQQAQAIFKRWLSENSGNYTFIPLYEIALINPDNYSINENWKHISYLDTSSITNGVIGEIQSINPQIDKLPSRAKRKIKNKDIVYSTVRPNQRHFGIITNPSSDMLVSTGFAVIRSMCEKVSNELIYLHITNNDFIEKMQQLAEQSTSTFPSIKPSDLGSCLIPCPNNESGIRLNEHLKSVYNMISCNNEQNNELAKLRDTLLPKLMSGEIDISNIEF